MTIYTGPQTFEDPTPSVSQRFGTAIGEGLGGGLSSGLKMLAESRVEEMKTRQLQKLLGSLAPSADRSPGLPQVSVEAPRAAIQEPSDRIEEPSGPPPELSDEDILKVYLTNPKLGKILQAQKENRQKQTAARAKREFEIAKPILKRAGERGEIITQKESALSLMENAIQEENLGFMSLDNLAKITGVEGFRSPKGAQFTSASKEYFLGSLKRAGSRPNQWIEQQIQKMLPLIGQSRAANQTVIETLKTELEVEKEQLRIIRRLAREDENKWGYVKGDIGERAREDLTTFSDKAQKDLEVRLRSIDAQGKVPSVSSDEVRMIDPFGNKRTLKKTDAVEAKKEGYKLL